MSPEKISKKELFGLVSRGLLWWRKKHQVLIVLMLFLNRICVNPEGRSYLPWLCFSAESGAVQVT